MATAANLHTFPLARFIENVRAITPPPGRAFAVERLPDGRTSLVFRVLEGGCSGDLWVAGPYTRAMFKSKAGVARTVVVRFKPGESVPLLGVAATELTDRVVPLEDVWGQTARDLCAELLATTNDADAIERVRQALALRACHALHTASGQLARRAVRLLEGGEARVGGVAHRLGVTERHLRRAFAENVGIGPKEFARIVRLQRALAMAATSSDWARIARGAGYCDQAHFIGDFRQLVGLTPGVFFKRSQPADSARVGRCSW